ncbi:hypothetical protein ACJ41O_003253 [Fusarium nematophilum]
MRLLNAHTCQLESFNGAEDDIPPYAILSHVWERVEITFQDITQQPLGRLSRQPAFVKVSESCFQARRDGFNYVWIDTCCIDKTSSAELSEAINSMFKWYQQSALCYVYLSDFDTGGASLDPFKEQGPEVHLEPDDTSFFASRWFTRGWTLQELIAPRNVDFFDRQWVRFGTRDGDLLDRVCQRTGIWPQLFAEPRCECPGGYPAHAVRDGICAGCDKLDTLPQTLDSFAVSIKMSWASSRVTTRKEDTAYCLLGLFSINMPMLYGEGDKAFLRLQEAIVRQSKDPSILLWSAPPEELPKERSPGCLAPSPRYFMDPVAILGRRVFNNVDRRYEADFLGNMTQMEMTDTALRMNLWLCPCTASFLNMPSWGPNDPNLFLGILDLAHENDYLVRPAILLEYMGPVDLYRRVCHQAIISVNPREESSVADNFHQVTDRQWHSIPIDFTRSLDEAFQKDIGILLQQSPINAVRTVQSLQGAPAAGPVYCVVTTRRIEGSMEHKIDSTIDIGGSNPTLSRYTARATQIPFPWAFKECHHGAKVERYFGGIHFVNFAIDAAHYHPVDQRLESPPQRWHVAVIWGMHREQGRRGAKPSDWNLWCRIFDMHEFINSARTMEQDLRADQLFGEAKALSPGEIQRRMEAQQQQLCNVGFKKFLVREGAALKPLFPTSCEGHWSDDSVEYPSKQFACNTRLSASVAKAEGLGRTLFELHFKIDLIAKNP